MGKEKFLKRTIYNGEKEFQLICPVCGCEEFSEQSVLLNKIPSPLPIDAVVYTCCDCTHMMFFANPKSKPYGDDQKKISPVDEFEAQFKKYSDSKLERIVNSSSYTEDAKKAARNLLSRRR